MDAAELSTSLTPVAGATGRRLAVERLRQAILSGDVAPGQRLVEEELAGTLGVTRASLRAALLDLTAEGLVERIPNRGARVRVVSTDEAVAITECRMALEALCAVKAAERITDEEAAAARELGEDTQARGRRRQPAEVLRAQQGAAPPGRGHLRPGGRGRPARPAARPAGQAPVPARAAARPPAGQSLPEHLAIIDAVAGRRPADADEAVRRHLNSVITTLRAGGTATARRPRRRGMSGDEPEPKACTGSVKKQ